MRVGLVCGALMLLSEERTMPAAVIKPTTATRATSRPSSSSAFASSDGIINLTGTDALDVGNMYFWRMAHLDSDGRYGGWTTSNFLVSSAESTWLGGDRYEFRMSNGNGTVDGLYPACMDTSLTAERQTKITTMNRNFSCHTTPIHSKQWRS